MPRIFFIPVPQSRKTLPGVAHRRYAGTSSASMIRFAEGRFFAGREAAFSTPFVVHPGSRSEFNNAIRTIPGPVLMSLGC
jgi:hypothetical protein